MSDNIRKNRKSQAALEFLMTYGWAILVVTIVIGSLAYFGVLNPSMLLPEKCTLPMGFYCKNFKILGSDEMAHTVYLMFENGMGKGVIIRDVEVVSKDGSIDCSLDLTGATNPYNDNYNDKPGHHVFNGDESAILALSSGSVGGACTIGKARGKIKSDITVKWHYDDASAAFTHGMQGEMLATIERDTVPPQSPPTAYDVYDTGAIAGTPKNVVLVYTDLNFDKATGCSVSYTTGGSGTPSCSCSNGVCTAVLTVASGETSLTADYSVTDTAVSNTAKITLVV